MGTSRQGRPQDDNGTPRPGRPPSEAYLHISNPYDILHASRLLLRDIPGQSERLKFRAHLAFHLSLFDDIEQF